jgi:hypothetical protein
MSHTDPLAETLRIFLMARYARGWFSPENGNIEDDLACVAREFIAEEIESAADPVEDEFTGMMRAVHIARGGEE